MGWKLVGFGSVIVVVAACSDVRLVPKVDQPALVTGKGQFCLFDPDEVGSDTKFLFVIDKSRSNTWTDPNGVIRATSIEAFVEQNRENRRYHYGLIAFMGEQALAYTVKTGTTAAFLQDRGEIFAATGRIRSEVDDGGTPFKAGLLASRLAIEEDKKTGKSANTNYIVMFISDGEPTDVQSESELDQLVQEIIDVEPGKVYLSAAFYSDKPNAEASARLARMAKVGKGKFNDFANSTKWDFSDLINEVYFEPWQLKSFLVYNMNAAFCEDGAVDVDSDGDGLCDRDELKIPGFDPTRRFSFAGGYSDLFHWRLKRYGGLPLPACVDRNDDDFDFLTNCEEDYIFSDQPSPGIPRRPDKRNPDTDRDGIVDGLETMVFFYRTLTYALDSLNLFEIFDGQIPAMTKLMQHRNPLYRDSGELGYDTTLKMYLEGTRPCFEMTQSVLPLYDTRAVSERDNFSHLAHEAGENVIAIYFIQTPSSAPKGDGVLKFSFQKLKNDLSTKESMRHGRALKISNEVFTTYDFRK